MSRKDYILLAEAIRKSDTLEDFIPTLISCLKRDNPSFDISRFRAACEK